MLIKKMKSITEDCFKFHIFQAYFFKLNVNAELTSKQTNIE